ncbi:MAG: hypothetical protein ACOX8A_07520 [Thermacetogeniaceae bacterium]|jgi:hypothetical protein
MTKKPTSKRRVSTYLTPQTIRALRLFAFEKERPLCAVIEAALKKCIPDRYFEGKEER